MLSLGRCSKNIDQKRKTIPSTHLWSAALICLDVGATALADLFNLCPTLRRSQIGLLANNDCDYIDIVYTVQNAPFLIPLKNHLANDPANDALVDEDPDLFWTPIILLLLKKKEKDERFCLSPPTVATCIGDPF